jgi:hypothetical protein
MHRCLPGLAPIAGLSSALVDPDSQDNYRYATDYGVYLADHLALIQVSRERKAAAKVVMDQLNSGKLNATPKERF